MTKVKSYNESKIKSLYDDNINTTNEIEPDDPHYNYHVRLYGQRVVANRRRMRISNDNHKDLQVARGLLIAKEMRDVSYTEALNIFLSRGIKQFVMEKNNNNKGRHLTNKTKNRKK